MHKRYNYLKLNSAKLKKRVLKNKEKIQDKYFFLNSVFFFLLFFFLNNVIYIFVSLLALDVFVH